MTTGTRPQVAGNQRDDASSAIRALSVRQPWASLIASGRKSVELRCWRTHYRGPLLIVSGGRPWKGEHGHQLGPLGVTVGLVELVDCRPFEPEDAGATCVPERILRDLTFQDPSAENPLGPRQWFSWVLKSARLMPNVPTRGMLKLFEPDATLLAAIGIG